MDRAETQAVGHEWWEKGSLGPLWTVLSGCPKPVVVGVGLRNTGKKARVLVFFKVVLGATPLV